MEKLNSRTIWQQIKNEVKVGDRFETWSTTGRARAIPFRIESVDPSELVIIRENDGKPYKVFRQSIEKMADVWDDYLRGAYPRAKMGEFTFASSYVLGIFAKLTGKVT